MTAALAEPDAPVIAAYRRLAPRYDRAHRRWLSFAGGEAQSAFEGALAAQVAPGMRVLDAGCGTGALARHILGDLCPGLRLTLVDKCPPMLAQAADLPALRVEGCLMALPFAQGTFDLVTCAWTLETTPDPARALAEALRVLRPGGSLLTAFCAETGSGGPVARLLCRAIRLRGTGRLLNPDAMRDAAFAAGAADVRRLRCRGPAAALLIRKGARDATAGPTGGDADCLRDTCRAGAPSR